MEFKEKIVVIRNAFNRNLFSSYKTHHTEEPFNVHDPKMYVDALFEDRPTMPINKNELLIKISEYLSIPMNSNEFQFIFGEIWYSKVYKGIPIGSNTFNDVERRINKLVLGYKPFDPKVEVILQSNYKSDKKFINFGTNPDYQKTNIESIDFCSGVIMLREKENNECISVPSPLVTLNSGKELYLTPFKRHHDTFEDLNEYVLNLCINSIIIAKEMGIERFEFVNEYFTKDN